MPELHTDDAAEIIAALTASGRTVAVAESLTGGLLVASIVAVPGASVALVGGVVAYNTALKHSVLGVDAGLLARQGAVHPEVAAASSRPSPRPSRSRCSCCRCGSSSASGSTG